jgi:hypothetical protein
VSSSKLVISDAVSEPIGLAVKRCALGPFDHRINTKSAPKPLRLIMQDARSYASAAELHTAGKPDTRDASNDDDSASRRLLHCDVLTPEKSRGLSGTRVTAKKVTTTAQYALRTRSLYNVK